MEAQNWWPELSGNDSPAAINKFQFGHLCGVGPRAFSTASSRCGWVHPVETVLDSNGGVSIWANTRLSYETHTKSLENRLLKAHRTAELNPSRPPHHGRPKEVMRKDGASCGRRRINSQIQTTRPYLMASEALSALS